MQRPNIIYVVAHDLGRELGLYGSGFRTPHLDAFARQGVVFNQAYCTSPACSPSRGCAMTGMTAHSNGLVGLANPGAPWSLPQVTRTVVDDLNDHGYQTVHAGMQHERLKGISNRYEIELETAGWVEAGVDGVIEYLARRPRDGRPFYLNLGTNEVHSGQWETYKCDRKHSRADVYGVVSPERVRLPDYIPDLPLLRREWGAFQGCVEYWDAQVGRLLRAIDDLGYRENTLVVITTDHGVAAERAKATLYKEGVSTSLLVRMPGGRGGGRRVEHMIPNIDLLPTLMEACAIPIRSEVQGRSFWPLLAGREYTPHDVVCLERNFHGDFDPMRSIRTLEHALIWNFDPHRKRHWLPSEVTSIKTSYERWFTELWPDRHEARPEFELFDRRRDPAEHHNVAADPAYAGVLRKLKDRLLAWMRASDDPLLLATDEAGFTRIMHERFAELRELATTGGQ